MGFAWEALVGLYDNLVDSGKKICPIAHKYITTHIGVLIDREGNFLVAMNPEVKGEMVAVPCTLESDGRTSGIAPHLLSDQIQYVAKMDGNQKRHTAYVNQLKAYVEDNPMDEYAQAICKYISKESLLQDIAEILPENSKIPLERLNVIFCVYGMPYEGEDPMWTEYYIRHLTKTGFCMLTGNPDYISDTYPMGILSPSSQARLFMKQEEKSNVGPGYIASQKIIHALQYLAYARKNAMRVEAEYNIRGFINSDITEEELKQWVEREYPGKWNEFYNILTNSSAK